MNAKPRTRFRGFSLALTPGELLLPLMLVLALLLGGGGSPAPLPELALEWIGLGVLGCAVWAQGRWSWRALAFVLGLAALPLLQLVRLPPDWWTSLPGRAIEHDALGLVGAAERWMPLSQAPQRTLAAVLALIPPGVALVLAARAGEVSRTLALIAVAVVALASVMVGAAQLAGGAASPFYLYGPEHAGYVTGFQANRNAAADVLAIGWLALVALAAGNRSRFAGPARRTALGAALALLAGGALLTGSRAGIVLFAATALTGGWWLLGTKRIGGRGLATLALVPALLVAIVAAPRPGGGALTPIAARFADFDDPRIELWTDTLYAARTTWPAGSGMGSFVPAFAAAERLEVVDASRANRAHNDFLELALEAGLAGLLVLAWLSVWLSVRFAARWRAPAERGERAELVFAAGTLAILAAHSVVDYPLRSMALAVLAGVAAGFILDRGGRQGSSQSGDPAEMSAS